MAPFNRIQRRRIGEILVDEGLVTKDHVEEALRIQRKTKETLGSILVDMGCITDLDITKTIVIQYQLPYIQLDNYKINDRLVDLVPAEFLYQHKILPFDQIGDMLICAVAEVPREEILAEIPRMTQRHVALYVTALSDLERHLQRLVPLPEEVQLEATRRRDRNRAAAQGDKDPAAKSGGVKPQIFEEQSSEAILQALDSTWDSIFENVGAREVEEEEDETDLVEEDVVEDLD